MATFMWQNTLPSVGAFVGGVTLPYSNILNGNAAFSGPLMMLAMGCAIGAALGDLLLHILAKDTGNFGTTIKRMATDAVYAGALSAIAALGLGLFMGGQDVTIQYLASAITGAGLYLMGSAHSF